jgi:hypothetical protein
MSARLVGRAPLERAHAICAAVSVLMCGSQAVAMTLCQKAARPIPSRGDHSLGTEEATEDATSLSNRKRFQPGRSRSLR